MNNWYTYSTWSIWSTACIRSSTCPGINCWSFPSTKFEMLRSLRALWWISVTVRHARPSLEEREGCELHTFALFQILTLTQQDSRNHARLPPARIMMPRRKTIYRSMLGYSRTRVSWSSNQAFSWTFLSEDRMPSTWKGNRATWSTTIKVN